MNSEAHAKAQRRKERHEKLVLCALCVSCLTGTHRAPPFIFLLAAGTAAADPPKLEVVRVSKDGTGFVLEPSGKKFTPWGFNYDHDAKGRLIEDYWDDEWETVKTHFGQMRQLGANVVRVHLQFGKFMAAADRPNAKALDRLGELLKLAEKEGLYLDLTGLGCYHKADVPDWYDSLFGGRPLGGPGEVLGGGRRAVQGQPGRLLLRPDERAGGVRRQAEAGRLAGRGVRGQAFRAVHQPGPGGRQRPDIARVWIKTLVAAIRKHDPKHLITVGLVDWSLDRPGLTAGSSRRRSAVSWTSWPFTCTRKPGR